MTKVNRRIMDPQTVLPERPVRSAATITPHPQRASQVTDQAVSSTRIGQSSKFKLAARDPRGTAPLYSAIVSKATSNNGVTGSPGLGTRIMQNNNNGNQDVTNVTDNLQTTLNTFFNRMQDLITPLISTLTLLVNKLLATHG
jgi:hypothetical protein